MTTAELPAPPGVIVEPRGRAGASLAEWLTTTDHKRVGVLYYGVPPGGADLRAMLEALRELLLPAMRSLRRRET